MEVVDRLMVLLDHATSNVALLQPVSVSMINHVQKLKSQFGLSAVLSSKLTQVRAQSSAPPKKI